MRRTDLVSPTMKAMPLVIAWEGLVPPDDAADEGLSLLGSEPWRAAAEYLCNRVMAAPSLVEQLELFQVQIDVPVNPAAEIEEVRWIDPAGDGGLVLAPLTRDLILPFYRASLAA